MVPFGSNGTLFGTYRPGFTYLAVFSMNCSVRPNLKSGEFYPKSSIFRKRFSTIPNQLEIYIIYIYFYIISK